MKAISVLLTSSVLLVIGGCVSNANLEKQVSALEKKIDLISSQCSKTNGILDINRDGSITRTEYNSKLRNIFAIQLKQLDANGDKRISKKELVTEKKTTSLFDDYDQNNDGRITEDEFVQYFGHRFDAADWNNDGKISIKDNAMIDTNKDGIIQKNEYHNAIDKIYAELGKKSSTKGYGYNCSHSPYMICDPSCIRCIALFVPFWGGGPGSYVVPGSQGDPCANVCCDPWVDECDPMDSCCDVF